MVQSYLADPTTKFAELKELTREQPGKNMVRQIAKTLMTEAAWEMEMGDSSVPPKHLSQLRRWIDVGQPPVTTYTPTPVEIVALTLLEVAGNGIVPTLPGMPVESAEWYRDKGIELLDTLGVKMGNIPTSVRMFWKNSISNRMHFLYSAAVSKTLGEASPATEVRKAPSEGSVVSAEPGLDQLVSRLQSIDTRQYGHHTPPVEHASPLSRHQQDPC